MLTSKATAKPVIDHLPEQATGTISCTSCTSDRGSRRAWPLLLRAKQSLTRMPNGACWRAEVRWAEPALADLESAGMLAQWPRWARTTPEAGHDDVQAFYRATTSINSISYFQHVVDHFTQR